MTSPSAPTDVLSRAVARGVLRDDDVTAFVAAALGALPLAGRRLLVLIPDGTRTFPVPLYFRAITDALAGRAAAVDFLIALGTHAPLDEPAIERLVGASAEERRRRGARVFNHAWDDPAALARLGMIPAEEIAALSQGRLRVDVPVRLNRAVLGCDHVLVCGPVFPHEVAGFSGGNKYLFPGIAGAEIIDVTHWLGALITSFALIGVAQTPVRQVIDRAAALIPTPRHALCSVVTQEGVAGLHFGTPEAAFAAAAQLSAERHIVTVRRSFNQVVSILPPMYDEIWVGAKGMYKTEPAVADGGEVIIYAPHVATLSRVHGATLRRIGYHVRDHFLAHWNEVSHLPWALLAHSTHLRGSGTYEGGIERPRIDVTLATGISEEECRAVNLGYRDWRTLDVESFAGREDEGKLLVRRAGEVLYRAPAR